MPFAQCSVSILQVSELCSGSAPAPADDADWVECAATVALLRAVPGGKHAALLLATEHMTRLSVGWRPPSTRQVAAFRC